MLRRWACVRQHDESDCGAAALATVALHYRRPIGLQQMRDLAGTDRIGTNLLGLLKAAERIGFDAKGVKGPYEELPGVPLPAVAHVVTERGLGHFVVLHRVSRNSVVVADPARGVAKMTREAFCKRWTGYLLLIAPRPEAAAAETAGATPQPWRRFVALLRPHAPLLLQAFACAVLLTVLGLASSFFIQHLVDGVLAHAQWRLLNALAIGMLALVVFRTLFGTLRQYLLAHVGRKVDLALVGGYARHVLRQPLRFFEMRRVGEILSRVNDGVRVRQALSGTTLTAVVDAVLVAVSMGVMFFYDWKLAAVVSGFIPVFLLAVGAHHPAGKRLSRSAMEDAGGLQAHLVEDISGVDAVKAYGAEGRRSEEADDRLVRMLRSLFSMQLLNLSMTSIGTLLTSAAGVVVLWYGGHRVIDGALSLGELLFFNSVLGFMLQPLERLATVNLQLQEALVAVDRLYEILDLEAEALEESGKAEFRGLDRALSLERVSFRYGCRRDVLKSVDLKIPAGSTVAIVGESGSGKSTILKLLMRFYDPTEGRLAADGVDLRDFTRASLRSRVGLVPQDPFLFTGTIRENIAFARPCASLDEVLSAARAAGLEEFIHDLPQRFDTVVGERGVTLSGGQRQRLAIARALLLKPEILVFDEATSHLDTETEQAIHRSLRAEFLGKTVVLVAHRLSTVRTADLIYVLHDGGVAESGSHDDLMAEDGRYAALWRAQTEGSEADLVPLVVPDGPDGFEDNGRAGPETAQLVRRLLDE